MQWGYDLRNSDCWQCDWFDTKEEAINAGREESKELDLDIEQFRVGQLSKYFPRVDFDYIVENAAEQAYDDCGEIAESWLEQKYLDKNVVTKYNEKLNALFYEFLAETNEIPSFGRIVNIEIVNFQ
jgi:hypothetical protein